MVVDIKYTRAQRAGSTFPCPLPALEIHEDPDAGDHRLVSVQTHVAAATQADVGNSPMLIGKKAVCALIVRQPDLGTSLLILLAALSYCSWGPALALDFSVLAAAIPVFGGDVFFIMHDYQKQRILTFLESDPLGTGWNIIQSKAAIGSAACS